MPNGTLSMKRSVPIELCSENAEADASQKNYLSSCSGPTPLEKCFPKKRLPSSSAATALVLSHVIDFRRMNA